MLAHRPVSGLIRGLDPRDGRGVPCSPAVGASHCVQEAGSVGRREASTGLAGPGLVEDSGPQGREGLKDTPILVWGDMVSGT